MKPKTVFTLLILMISFAGFSLTATDLCQNSNHEAVLPLGSTEIHGVVDFNAESTIYVFKAVETNIETPAYIMANTNDRAIFGTLDLKRQSFNLQTNASAKTLTKTKPDILMNPPKLAYRRARDGLSFKC